ncbi:hypothetical protein C7999DRAFT_34599 [Corynascus novoguineensis]|uniref:F-box domain-containing protein n=1 Tax=Corynascus novoguineensis TaxID=1126955 RepID=A0AAN7CMZ8_9PEZI|nr:hypothetical protein C7999DRAFT_34599 [Corynascus novoguineensis]
MEPSRLPPELFDRIMGYASGGRSDVKLLCNFSLVSCRWYAAVIGRIYSRWLYDGEHHSISSLWKFLRSILSSRRIADGVHELDIRNWPLGLVYDHGLLVLQEDDLNLIRNAIRMGGLERIENSALNAVQKADSRPLMALLLAHLGNLTTLYAHLPETDIFLAEVLRKAVEDGQDQQPTNGKPLNRLREVHLTSAWNYRAAKSARDNYTLALNHLDTLSPNLKSLTLYGDEGLALNKTLGRQLQDVVTSTDFQFLGHVALEVRFEEACCYRDPADPPHHEVERACREVGTKYETKDASSCTKGGVGCQYYRHVIEKRLQMNRKLDVVRYALTKYLSELRKSTDMDDGSTADRREMSSDDLDTDDLDTDDLDTDDLDTYELPWDDLYPEQEPDLDWRFYPELDYELFTEDWDEEELDEDDIDSQEFHSQQGESEESGGDSG